MLERIVARFGACLACLLLSMCGVAFGQEAITLDATLLFYGDDTEFSNPFRSGETLFGAVGRLSGTITLNDRASVTLGLVANHRFGSDEAFELVRPIASLTIRGSPSQFVFGTLPEPGLRHGVGPDRASPHGLLPPIQRDSLHYERPYEAGLQWTLGTRRLQHETWINWQKLNTPGHRERFDAGVSGRASLARWIAVGFQVHAVHQGGQLYAVGPVVDSLAYATGAIVEREVGPLGRGTVELWGLLSHHDPDRERPARTRNGSGLLARAAAERGGWRGHVLVWRACDFIKDEGDPNYQSIRQDGSRYRATRDYSEAGLTRRFPAGSQVTLEASTRLHRIERHYEPSFRIVAVAHVGWRVR